MTAEELRALRDRLGLTQAEMAKKLDVSVRTILETELGRTPIRDRTALAAERVALAMAVERANFSLAPASVRKDALELARLIRGE